MEVCVCRGLLLSPWVPMQVLSLSRSRDSRLQFSTGPASWVVDCDLLTYFPERCRSHGHFLSRLPSIQCTNQNNKTLSKISRHGNPNPAFGYHFAFLCYTILPPWLVLLSSCSCAAQMTSLCAFSPSRFLVHLHHATVTVVRQGRVGKGPKYNVSLTFEKMLNLILWKYIY